MRKNALIGVTHNADNDTLTFTVGEGAGSFDLSLNDLTVDISKRALIHGLVQKISDGAAIPKADLPKKPADAAKAKFDAMLAIRDRIAGPDGEWSKRNGDGSGPVAGIIFRAFAEYVGDMAEARKATPPSADAIRARYDALDRAGQLALRNIPEVAAIMERIRSERGASAAKSVDTDALLGDLGL